MDIALLILVTTILCSLRFREYDHSRHCFDREVTGTLSGVFVLLVVMSHFNNTFALPDSGSYVYHKVQNFLGQLIVVPFFLFSGYGTMISIKRKGPKYLDSFPSNKVVRLLLHFDLCLIPYVLLNAYLSIYTPIPQLILSMLTIDTIGNSNWFITVTLICYIILFLGHRFIHDDKEILPVFATVLAFYVVLSHFISLPTRYYNTVLAFPIGMALAGDGIDIDRRWKRLSEDKRRAAALALACTVVTLGSHLGIRLFGDSALYLLFQYTKVITFIALLVIFCSLFTLDSRILSHFGKSIFGIYMMQRLPMRFMNYQGILEGHTLVQLGIVLISSTILSLILYTVLHRFDSFYDLLTNQEM